VPSLARLILLLVNDISDAAPGPGIAASRREKIDGDDAWLRPGLEIAFAIPTSTGSGDYGVDDFSARSAGEL
jgi:hypothetical protein